MIKFNCYLCGSDSWMPKELYDAASCSSSIIFYCAYGHPQRFSQPRKKLLDDKALIDADRAADKATKNEARKIEIEGHENVILFPKG